MVYPEVLQGFSAEIYLVRISIQKQLIKVAIYEIYGMQWEAMSPRFTFGGAWLPGPYLVTPMKATTTLNFLKAKNICIVACAFLCFYNFSLYSACLWITASKHGNPFDI